MTTPSLKILLADDSKEEHFLFKHVVKSIDPHIKVESVRNGKELVKILMQPDALMPDLVFLDLNMPLQSGKSSLAEIRKNKKLSQLPILIYSTSDDKNDIDETHALGANLYIRKPQDFEDLEHIITGVIKKFHEQGLMSIARDNYVFTLE